jgi:putative adhesin
MKFRAIQICLVFIVATAGVLARSASNDDVISQKVERTISADPSVTVSICVMSGSISVHGWDKNEVLARSSDAAQIELRQKDGAVQSGKAMKVEVFVVDKSDEERVKHNCQAYSDLELFVPRAASVHVQTRDGDIDIADIAVAVAGTQNGDISVERVSRAVEVGSVGGSVSIKDSTGRASVTTIGGGIEVLNLRPTAAADGFEAVSVSGDLNLEGVSHSQLHARTVTGDVHLTGPLAAGGRYGFKTMSGDITLTLPGDSSFNLSAKVSNDGEIISDFPLTLIPDAAPPSAPAPATSPAPAPAPAPSVSAASSVPPMSPAPASAAAPGSPVIVRVAPRMSKVIVTTPITVSISTMRRVNAVCGAGDASIQVASFSGTLHLLKK